MMVFLSYALTIMTNYFPTITRKMNRNVLFTFRVHCLKKQKGIGRKQNYVKKNPKKYLSAETQINSHSSGFKDSPSLMYKKGQLKVGSLVYSVVVLNDKAPIDGKNNQQFPQQDY